MKSIRKHLFSSDSADIIFLIVMFFMGQLTYHFAHAGFFSAFNQLDFIVDVRAIFAEEGHFWESIFYYHLAPPLYVLYASLFYKYFPPHGEIGFYFFHTLLGVYTVYSLYKIQRRLDIHPILATALTTIFILSPSFNLAESSAFYDFPAACLLIISTWHLAKLLDQPRLFTSLIFFTTIALLCSIRSLYNIVLYMVPLIIITLLILRREWKIILMGSLLPFLFVLAPYLKNYILYDAFTTSSYFGETLDSATMQFYVTLKQREEGIKQGFFSDLALCPSTPESVEKQTINSKLSGWYCYGTFADQYRRAYIQKINRKYANIPLLSCDPILNKETGVYLPRRSCLGNIGMSKEYQKNAFQAILHYPHSYKKSVTGTLRQYFNNTVSYYFEVASNQRKLSEDIQKSWLRWKLMQKPNLKLSISLPLLFAYPLLCFFSMCYLFYSNKGINLLICLYLTALFFTICKAIINMADSSPHLMLKSWDLQAVLIISIIKMVILLTLMTLLLRFMINKLNGRGRQYLESLIHPSMEYNKRVIVVYLLANIIFTSIIIVFLVGIAQQRYRFYIDGLYLILLSLIIQTTILPLFKNLSQFLTTRFRFLLQF